MSRYAQSIGGDAIIEYGYDPVPTPGYFYSIEKMKQTPEGRLAEVIDAGDTREAMITHQNETQMNRSEIVEVLQEHGVRENHIEKMTMDQPF